MTDISSANAMREPNFQVPIIKATIADTPAFDSESEAALELRFGRLAKKHEDLVYEFTRDPGLLHQYYRMYEEQFKLTHNADSYKSIEDEHDRRGYILIARRGNLCVGGARLSIKTPRQPELLPIEINDFRIEKHFPHLRQKQMSYGQVSRLVLLPDYRGGPITLELFRHIHRKAAAVGIDVLFGTATRIATRVYKQNCAAIKTKEVKVHFDIELPTYPMCDELKFYLISIVINKELFEKEDYFDESALASKPETVL